MRLVSWNVQWCRGMDGRVDPARIAAEIRRLGDPDLICLQEVAANYPELEGSAGEDQPHLLAHQFPQHQICIVSGIDVPGRAADGRARRAQFGNLVLSRFPVGRVLRHSLPWPPSPDVPSMPRVAVEAVVQAPFGEVRILTTHLEYYSHSHRAAQVGRLRALHAEACAERLAVEKPGPFATRSRPPAAILCGDFNMPPEDALHAVLGAPFPGEAPSFVDAWTHANPHDAHPPTFHVHDDEDAYCCDYVYVTEDLLPRLRSVRIDADTRASDHQPVIVELS